MNQGNRAGMNIVLLKQLKNMLKQGYKVVIVDEKAKI
jgi:hypothetical protein